MTGPLVSQAIPRSPRGAGPETSPLLLPPLKWAGGKRWQVPHLRPLWEEHAGRRLVEPFCGGLAVTLGLRPARALLNDINPHVISFYRWLKRGLRIDLAMRNEERLYYAHRARFNELLAAGRADERETAALFYYLNRTTIPYRRNFSHYRDDFARWEFTSQDLESIPLDRGDFVYADPPYDVEFTDYAKEGFTWEDQVRAAEWLARHRGPVVLSNQATDRIVALYETLGFTLRYLAAPRRISCTGDRSPAREVLALKGI